MALTAGMVASEILLCGVKAGIKQIPIVGEMAVHVVEGLQKRHEAVNNAARMAEIEAQLSRVERNMRDTVEKEIRMILTNLGRPAVPGPELTCEMNELRQIYEQGWMPSLFEGILRNSTHWPELRRNPRQYGRILGDHEPVDPENGMHLLLDKDRTRILELPAASFATLLSDQSVGIPAAEVRAAQDIWAFPSSKAAPKRMVVPHPAPLPPPIEFEPDFAPRVLFRGLVLCCFAYQGVPGRPNYLRCKMTVTNMGITLAFPEGTVSEMSTDDDLPDVSEISTDDLHYADITYNEDRPWRSVPPDFENGVRVELAEVEYDFRLKLADWEKLRNALDRLRGNAPPPRY
jgi:hypothetical protein